VRIAVDARPITRTPSGVGHTIRNSLRATRATTDEFLILHHEPELLAEDAFPRASRVVRARFSPESHPMGDLWYELALPRLLRRERVDVFHGEAFAIPRDHRGFATVVTIPDVAAFTAPETIPWRFRLLLQMHTRHALARATRILTISRAVEEELVRLEPRAAGRIRIVYSGVDARFRPLDDFERVRPLLSRLGIDRPYALFIGNIEPRKNLLGVLRAYERIANETGGEVALVIVGAKGWLYNAIFEKAESLRGSARPILTGYLTDDEVADVLAAARVLLFPSLYEGFGLPIVEAMRCRVPVVTSDRGAMREIAGDAALLVDPLDDAAIAAAALRILSDAALAERLAARGQAHAAPFTWERAAAQTLDIYREAAALA
jgi:glycosyltransferase involved in cell wall biosynthesis